MLQLLKTNNYTGLKISTDGLCSLNKVLHGSIGNSEFVCKLFYNSLPWLACHIRTNLKIGFFVEVFVWIVAVSLSPLPLFLSFFLSSFFHFFFSSFSSLSLFHLLFLFYSFFLFNVLFYPYLHTSTQIKFKMINSLKPNQNI